MGAGYGDRLARGAHKANFGTMSHIKQEDWNKMFEDFDAEKFKEIKPSKGAKDTRPVKR